MYQSVSFARPRLELVVDPFELNPTSGTMKLAGLVTFTVPSEAFEVTPPLLVPLFEPLLVFELPIWL